MMDLLNSAILGLSIILFLLSYKKDMKVKKCIIFYILHIILQLILRNYITYWITSDLYTILKILLYYVIIKLIFKDKINILDIFYILYGYFFIELFNKVLKQEILANIIVLVITFILFANREKVQKLNYKVIKIWNERNAKSLTLRSIFVICINICFFIICTWLLV